MADQTLIAGPWTGSLLGELMCWQGYLRSQCKNYNKTIVVVSNKSHAFLYRDFASEIIEPENLEDIHGTRLLPHDVPVRWVSQQPVVDDQIFNSLAKTTAKKKFSLAICASVSDQFTKKDWAEIAASQPIEMDIAWVSDIGEAHILGGSDYRKRALGSVASAIRASNIVIAPSGGIAALSGLCGIPYITWLPTNLVNLYKDIWNPMSTSGVAFKGHPKASQVIEAIKRIYEMQANQDKEMYQD